MIEANCDIFWGTDPCVVTVRFPPAWADGIVVLKEQLEKKRITQAYVKLAKPRKPRTTGDFSQNHHLNGHIAQIVAQTGDEFEDVKMEIKRRAIKRGYPFHTDSFGNVVPQSEANCSTTECAMLIDEAHDVAAFLNIKLREE